MMRDKMALLPGIGQIAKPITPAHFTACQCGANLTTEMGHK